MAATTADQNLGPAQLVRASLSARGNRQLEFDVTGDGLMRFANGVETEVGISYDAAARQLLFAARGDSLSTQRFTDHLVLFDAGVGLRLDASQAAGEVVTTGTLGIFARRALSNPVREDDFHVVVRHAQTRYALNAAARTGTFTLEGGEMILPENFTGGLCEPGGNGIASRPSVRVSAEQPIMAALKLAANSTAQQLVIDSIRFTGSVALSNVGYQIAQLPGLAADLCTGRIDFPGIEIANGTLNLETLPRLHITEGRLSVPLPPGQITRATIRNAEFDFAGVPTGSVTLEEDVVLLKRDGFVFSLLGGASCGSSRPATALSVQREASGLKVVLNGGVQLRLPGGILQTDAVEAGPISALGCATLVLRENGVPELTVDRLAATGHFQLASKLRLRDAFAEVLNPSGIFQNTPFALRLGGRLELEGVDGVFFQVKEGRIGSDLAFRIEAEAGAFDFGVGALASASVIATGGRDGLTALGGNGMMRFGSGPETGVDVKYDGASQTLLFAASASNLASLHFTDHLVLFDARAALRVGGARQSAELTTVGTLGLFSRRLPLVDPVREEDFQLVTRNAQATFAFDVAQRRGSLTVDQGELLLPPNFSAGLCVPGAGGVRPSVQISPLNPVRADLRLAAGSTAQQVTVESIRFIGGINVANLGLTLSQLPGFATELCDGRMDFPAVEIRNNALALDALPRLTVREGRLSLPLPPGEITHASIQEAVLDFEGVPTGIITLDHDVSLLDRNGFALTLLGGNSCGPNRPATSLTVERVNGQPVLTLSGGVRLTLPGGMIEHDTVEAGAVSAEACASLVLRPNELPVLTVDRLRAEGNFRMPGGLRLRDGFAELLNPGGVFSGGTTTLSLGGRLELTGVPGAFFQLDQARLSSDLTFQISATTGGFDLGPGRLQRATVTARGGVTVPPAFGGNGSMLLAGGVQTGVELSYDAATQTLLFTLEGGNLGNLRLTDHAVLFNARAGVRVSGAEQSGALTTTGTLGLFAKQTPLADPIEEEDFHLVVRNAQTTLAVNLPQLTGTFTIDGGELLLPPLFTAGLCEDGAERADGRPLIRVEPDRPITLTLKLLAGSTAERPVVESVNFSGSIGLSDIGFAPPELAGFGAELCDATLDLPSLEVRNGALDLISLPRFTIHEGRMAVPLPPGQTNYASVRNAVFDFTGFPTGTIQLDTDILLLDQGGFQFALLGGDSCGLGNPATGLTVTREGASPVFTLNGGVRVRVPESVLQNDSSAPTVGQTGQGTRVEVKACGALVLRQNQIPELSLDTLRLAGSFKLAGGLQLREASIELQNLRNVFNGNLDPPNPFTIALGGVIQVPQGPGFGLLDTTFVFNNRNPNLPGQPQLVPGTLIYDGSQWPLTRVLPLQVESATLTFKRGDAAFPDILKPTNIVITTTAQISLPAGNDPVLGGAIKDLQVTFREDGVPLFSLDGIGLDIQPGKLKIPPFNDLGGQLYLGGLSDPIGHPERLFFAGKLTGTYSEMKLGMLAAFKLNGAVGL